MLNIEVWIKVYAGINEHIKFISYKRLVQNAHKKQSEKLKQPAMQSTLSHKMSIASLQEIENYHLKASFRSWSNLFQLSKITIFFKYIRRNEGIFGRKMQVAICK